MKILEVDQLSYTYGKKTEKYHNEVLKELSFSMEAGENVGLIGANGVGKSTLLKLMAGLLEMQEGEVRVAGYPMKKENLKKIRQKLGYVFQDSDSQLFLSTIYEDVAFAPRNYGYAEEEVEKRTLQALERVGLLDWRYRQIYRLSGGEKKLASIATVLVMEVQLLLFDEPTVALDPKNRRNLIRIIRQMPEGKLIASHDLDFIYDTCERTILLADGKIVADGRSEVLLRDQELLEKYGLELPLSFSR